MITKQDIQNKALSYIIPALEEDKTAIVFMGTGTTKTVTSIRAVSHFNPESLLWLTNSERLRDEDSPQDFTKWGYDELLAKTQFECIQTAYKWTDRHFPFVVVDEADFMMTKEYFNFFRNNTWDYMLLVTATTTDEKMEFFNQLGKVVFNYSTQDAQNDGVLNQSKITFVDFVLDKRKNIPVSYTNKKTGRRETFYTSENDQYAYHENQFLSKLITLQNLKKEYHQLTIDIMANNGVRMLEIQELLPKIQSQLKRISNNRSSYLIKLSSSRNIATQVINHLYQDPNNKMLVFCARTEQVDKLCNYTYHSKNKKNNPNIDKINNNEIRILGVVSVLDRGANLNGINCSVLVDYDSSKTKMQQRHGRNMRLLPDDIANIYILRPFYEKVVQSKDVNGNTINVIKRFRTRACDWVDVMTEDFDESKFETIELSVI